MTKHIVCIASEHKGNEFLDECHSAEWHVTLVTRKKLLDEMRQEMADAAATLKFEQAARLHPHLRFDRSRRGRFPHGLRERVADPYRHVGYRNL